MATIPNPPSRMGKYLLAAGDSWVDYRLGDSQIDLRKHLKDFDYSFELEWFCKWQTYGLIQSLARDSAVVTSEFLKYVVDYPIGRAKHPVAILLSGGGNDSVEDALSNIIVVNDNNPQTSALDAQKLTLHIANLKIWYEALLVKIQTRINIGNVKILVITHGYDYPIPRGVGRKSWLYNPFFESGKGYALSNTNDLKKVTAAVRTLIDAIHDMLIGLSGDPRFKSFLKHVDLRGTISTNWPGNASQGWENDMHPKSEGFRLMALKIDAAIDAGLPT